MPDFYNYKSAKILFVDDEALTLKYFARNLEATFDILTAPSADEALDILRREGAAIGIIVTDQRMPGTTGVEFLEKARQVQPRAIRILATAYADMDATIAAVNTGAIYKYVTKPFDFTALELTLKRALEFHLLQRERDQLLREKMGALHRMMMTDRLLGLGVMASGLGHHLRNSLVAVKAFLDMAPAKLAAEQIDLHALRDPDYWNAFYAQAQDQLTKITRFLKSIDTCVAQPAHPIDQPVDLAETLREALARHARDFEKRGITVSLEIDPALPPLTGNAMLLLEVFAGLLKEQAAFLASGTHITLHARPVVGIPGAAPRVEITLADDGPGLPEDALYKLFDPFYIKPGSPSDFAVGLLSCFFMVHHHGGTLETDAAPRAPFRFRAFLPVTASPGDAASDERAFLKRVFEVETMWEMMLIHP